VGYRNVLTASGAIHGSFLLGPQGSGCFFVISLNLNVTSKLVGACGAKRHVLRFSSAAAASSAGACKTNISWTLSPSV
jgi:hypothetical protein